jgi:hypothetical protein
MDGPAFISLRVQMGLWVIGWRRAGVIGLGASSRVRDRLYTLSLFLSCVTSLAFLFILFPFFTSFLFYFQQVVHLFAF